jgi:hypothetical protein
VPALRFALRLAADESYGGAVARQKSPIRTVEGSIMAPKQTSKGSPKPALHHRYHALLDPPQTLTSEQHLMLALLADAVDLTLRNDPAEHQAAVQAWDWILGFGPASISFEDACDAVGLDHCALRKYLRRLRSNWTRNGRRH